MKGVVVKPNIVFKLEKFNDIEALKRSCLYKLDAPWVIDLGRYYGSTNLLYFEVLHQRASTIRGEDEPSLSCNMLLRLERFASAVVSHNMVALSSLQDGVLYLVGSTPTGNISAVSYNTEAELSFHYRRALTLIKAWSEHGCFTRRETIHINHLVEPEEIPRWEEDPSYFVL